jgi:hypothetical protein
MGGIKSYREWLVGLQRAVRMPRHTPGHRKSDPERIENMAHLRVFPPKRPTNGSTETVTTQLASGLLAARQTLPASCHPRNSRFKSTPDSRHPWMKNGGHVRDCSGPNSPWTCNVPAYFRRLLRARGCGSRRASCQLATRLDTSPSPVSPGCEASASAASRSTAA